jgi:hypothetical protein
MPRCGPAAAETTGASRAVEARERLMAASGRYGVRTAPWGWCGLVCDWGLTSRYECGYIVLHGAHRGWSVGRT